MSDKNSVVFKNHGLKWNTSSDVEEIIEKISCCQQLTSLTLTGSSLGVEAAETIANTLKNKSSLKHLYMNDLFTGRDKHEIPKALEHIFGAVVQSNATIETLDLSDNALGPHGMKVMKTFLPSIATHLRVLVLNNNGLGSLGSELLSSALVGLSDDNLNDSHPLQLVELYCGRNRLEDEGAKNISKIIKCVSTLKVLKMPQNGIQYKGINELCQSLASNPFLECLDLNDNIITEKGAKFLADYMGKFNHLVELDLGDCLLRDAGGIHISSALKSTKSPLTKLNITYNELSGDILKSIVNSLAERTTNLSLLLDGNMIGKRGRTAILDLLKTQQFITYDGIENDESTDEEEEHTSNADDEDNTNESLASEFRKMGIS